MTNATQTVHGEILRQLGGNKFLAMTGSSNLIYGQDDLRMKLTRNKSGANHLVIKLEANDTYTMTFTAISIRNNEFVVKEKAKLERIYNDQLQEIFTRITGLHTAL